MMLTGLCQIHSLTKPATRSKPSRRSLSWLSSFVRSVFHQILTVLSPSRSHSVGLHYCITCICLHCCFAWEFAVVFVCQGNFLLSPCLYGPSDTGHGSISWSSASIHSTSTASVFARFPTDATILLSPSGTTSVNSRLRAIHTDFLCYFESVVVPFFLE